MSELFSVPSHVCPRGWPLYPRWFCQIHGYLNSWGNFQASSFWTSLLSHVKCSNFHSWAMSLSSYTCPRLLAVLFTSLWRCHYFGSLLTNHGLSPFIWLTLFEVFWNPNVSHTVTFGMFLWGKAGPWNFPVWWMATVCSFKDSFALMWCVDSTLI